jgi:hypothetical protein
MMSMASDVGRSPLIALRSIGHAERTTAGSIAAANVTASPGRLTAANQLRSPPVPTGMFMNTFTGWGTVSVANPICATSLCTLSAQQAWPEGLTVLDDP